MSDTDARLLAELRQARAERDLSEGDVGRLRRRIAELLDERTSTNAALAETTTAFRAVEAERDALRARVGELETASRRYRTAWQMARTRALSTGNAADRYAARARDLQTALQDATAAILGAQIERDELLARVAELETGAARCQADHQAIVDQCKRDPGQWICLPGYRSNETARQIASKVRHARLLAYAPDGAFEARAAGAQVYVRYVATPGVVSE
jgi:uncharacterized coiled-coil DUF342 family protein